MTARHFSDPIGKKGSCRKREGGQSLVELGLLLPLLTLLFFGAVDVGRLFYLKMAVQDAARAGAAWGLQSNADAANTTGIAAAAQQDASDITGLQVTSTNYCECWNTGGTMGSQESCNPAPTDCTSTNRYITFVQVSTSDTFTPIFAGFHGLPSSFTITGQATMRVPQTAAAP